MSTVFSFLRMRDLVAVDGDDLELVAVEVHRMETEPMLMKRTRAVSPVLMESRSSFSVDGNECPLMV